MDTYVKIIFIIAILFISYILYSIFIFTDVSAYFEACGAGTILIDNNDRFNKPISHQSVSPCADDTTRIFGMLNLTRFQKNAVVSFIKMINDTLSNAVYYSQGTAPSVTKLSDAWYMLLYTSFDTKANSLPPTDWTGNIILTEMCMPGKPLTFIPYNGIRSNNIDSAYVKTSLKYSDIKQKTNVSLLMLTRTPVGNNLEYDGGFFYNAEEERKFMQIGGTAGSISYCGNFGEHTGRVISPDVPKMLINTRYGLAEGTDSIWAFYGGNGKDLMSYYFEQHEVDTTSIFVNEPTFSICAINYSLEERPKFFSTRGIGFIGVTKFALNSNGARALSRCVNWLDNVFGVHDWESDTLFTRMTTLPDSDKAGINEAIIELKDSLNIRRLSDKFKRFSIYLMNDTINALKDWTTNRHDAITTGASFTSYYGFNCANSRAINTSINPYTSYPNNGGNLYQNYSMGVGTYTNSTIAGYDLAVVGTAIDYLYISAKYTDNNCYIRTWSKYASVANINSSGLYILSILSSSNVICNRNGINLINDFQNHNILYPPNYNIYVGVLNNAGTLGNFTNRTYYCDFEGDKLTSDECRMVYNIVKKFCARKGQSLSIIQNNKAIPEKYFLSQNFPNPFNPITNIKFQIKESNFVTLKVYNALGEEIATLVNKNLNAGTYSTEFSGLDLSSGIYFYTIRTGNFTATKRMVLLK